MPRKLSVAVIGCGVFGAMTALRLSDRGAATTVFERLDAPLLGASFNNQNRLHLGFHYPRDEETARQCIRGFQRFRDEFGECLLDSFTNAYFIAAEGSAVTPNQYIAFCHRMGLRNEQVDPLSFSPPVHQVALGLTCDEVVYDCGILRTLVMDRLTRASIRPEFGQSVERIARDGAGFRLQVGGQMHGPFDAVVNCTYADVNRLTEQLGHVAPQRQYEYTMVPILNWDRPPVGITIMDGAFMTVLPFGRTGKFLLYHVAHTVVERFIGDQKPHAWLDPSSAPSAQVDEQALFKRMLDACSFFVPDLRHARLAGFLHGPRVVLAHRDSTDARPSIIQRHEDGYISVFTGKIDHCMWVADDIADMLIG